MDNKDIAAVLEQMATLMELKGENPFRCRAFANAARRVETLEESAAVLIQRGELGAVRGIGKGLVADITELVNTGEIAAHNQLLAATPPGLMEMLGIPGLGAKRVRTIHEKLGVQELHALAEVCASGEVAKLSGFGKKTAERILEGIDFLNQHKGLHLLSTATAEACSIRDHLLDHPAVCRLEIAGSVRRFKETTKDVDLVASSNEPAALAEAFTSLGDVERVVARGETKISVVLASGMPADLRIVEDEAFAFALAHFTGSREHNKLMRRRAKDRGMKLNEYGLFKGEELVACEDEAAIYKALGLAPIAPELREGLGEIEQAEQRAFPELIGDAHVRGDLHMHSTASDGRIDIAGMARAATERGYGYIGICDHSKSAGYANGLTEARLRDQWVEIDRVNGSGGDVRVLKGIEVDILGDGQLDFEDDFLAEFDLVIASVHSRFGMTQEEATERIVRAVRDPHVDILGHPSGRLLLTREGYPLDTRAVIDAAAESGTAIELNANPHRLDLDWRYLGYARERGVKIAINTDAHSVEGLNDMRYGTGIARKGALKPGDVLNTLEVEALLSHLHRQA